MHPLFDSTQSTVLDGVVLAIKPNLRNRSAGNKYNGGLSQERRAAGINEKP